MRVYLKVNDTYTDDGYRKGQCEKLIEKGVPSVYLGDFKDNCRPIVIVKKLSEDMRFKIPLGTDIIKFIVEKFEDPIEGSWTEANGIIYIFRDNMVYVLDYKPGSDYTSFE